MTSYTTHVPYKEICSSDITLEASDTKLHAFSLLSILKGSSSLNASPMCT